jgi:rRNA maturation endonuclease Nob1
MKPTESYKDEWYGMIYICTKCKEREIWRDFNFCPLCGTKIDWSNESK